MFHVELYNVYVYILWFIVAFRCILTSIAVKLYHEFFSRFHVRNSSNCFMKVSIMMKPTDMSTLELEKSPQT